MNKLSRLMLLHSCIRQTIGDLHIVCSTIAPDSYKYFEYLADYFAGYLTGHPASHFARRSHLEYDCIQSTRWLAYS